MSKYKFDAEIGKVLNIVINSIYTNREIFLRELVSNSSDAISKLQYYSIQNSELLSDGWEPKITVEIQKDKRILKVLDSGIGMDKQDMRENLGTIAKSGTEAFSKAIESGTTGGNVADLIGQFGVGFYSAFMVADEVAVLSRKAGQGDAFLWKSKGNGEYTIDVAEKPEIGTQITLHIKNGEEFDEFLDKFRVEHIIKSYSSHINTPIEIIHETGSSMVHSENSAIWLKNPNQVSEEEYQKAFNSVGGISSGYFAKIHSHVEGSLEYSALLFIPNTKPYDLYNPHRKTSIKIYIKRVFITEENTEILPEHLRFVKGVVDSSDLPLNISRETLQNNTIVHKIGKALEKKIIAEFEKKLKENRVEYTKFWENFGNVIKEGLCKAGDLNKKLLEICIFKSTHNAEENTTIEEYISRMKPDQDSIYYITAESFDDGFNNPQLEACKKNGIEVLILTDTVDNFWVNVITNYNEKHFKPVNSADLTLENNTQESEVIDEDKNKTLIEEIQKVLGKEISQVKISKKLTESPVCLSQSEGGMSIRMERYLFEQKQLPFISPKILEINPNHQVLENIHNKLQNKQDASQEIQTLFDIACIEAGDVLRKPSDFAKRVVGLMKTV